MIHQTCEYLDMIYRGCYYHYSGKDPQLKAENKSRAEKFIKTLWQKD